MKQRSLEERVNCAHRQLALMRAACLAITNLDVFEDDEQGNVLEAIAELARDAADLLEPLIHAPGEIANWEPPDPEPDATEPAVPRTSPRSSRHGLRALPPRNPKPGAASLEDAS